MVPSANHRSQRAAGDAHSLRRRAFAAPLLRRAARGWRWPSRKDGGCQAAAWGEFAANDAPFRLDGVDDVVEHFVHGVFVEDAEVAVGQQVHFQRFELDAVFARHVLDSDGAEVGQAGFWADRGVLRKFGGDDVARELIGPGFQRWQFRVDACAGVFFGVVGHEGSWRYYICDDAVARRPSSSRGRSRLSARKSAATSNRAIRRATCVEIDVLDGHVPVRVENFEAVLLFPLVGVLIGKKLLEQRRGIEIVVSDFGVLENDGGAIVPAAVFGAVIAGSDREHFQDAAELHFFLEQRVVIFLEKRDEFVGVTPLCFVVVLDDEGPFLGFSAPALASVRSHRAANRERAASLALRATGTYHRIELASATICILLRRLIGS